MSATRPFLALLGGVFLLLGLAILLGAQVPPAILSQTVAVDPQNLYLLTDPASGSARYPEDLTLRIDMPARVTVGQPATATVEVQPIPSNPPIAGTPQDATRTTRPVVVSRLSSSLASVAPDGDEGQSLVSGRPVKLAWTLTAPAAGSGDVNLVVRLRFYPVDGSAPVERVLLARAVTITAVSVLGLSAGAARIVGAILSILGLGLLVANGRQAWLSLRRA